MSYQVLARKYRPKNFDTLVGQEHVVRALTHALQTQRLHHAYLFTGTRGVGKTTLSRILAKSFNCIGLDGQGDITAQPCGACEVCLAIDAGRFVDYIEMDAASNRGVDEMAQLLEQAVYAPSNARFKVYMIDEVHMLTNTAFNAMLKTLEEPPPHIKFILATTDPQKIPVTVLSRCLQFNLKQMPPGHIIGHLEHILGLENIEYETPALRLLAQGAHGSMRDALSLTDQAIAYAAGKVTLDAVQGMLGALDQSFLLRLLDALAREDGKQLLAVADEMASRSLSYNNALQDLASLLHQLALAQTVPQALPGDLPEREEVLRLAQLFEPQEVQLFYQIAVHGRNELGLAPDEYAGFSMTLLRMLAFRPAAAGSMTPAAAPPVARPTSAAPQRSPAAAAMQQANPRGQEAQARTPTAPPAPSAATSMATAAAANAPAPAAPTRGGFSPAMAALQAARATAAGARPASSSPSASAPPAAAPVPAAFEPAARINAPLSATARVLAATAGTGEAPHAAPLSNAAAAPGPVAVKPAAVEDAPPWDDDGGWSSDGAAEFFGAQLEQPSRNGAAARAMNGNANGAASGMGAMNHGANGNSHATASATKPAIAAALRIAARGEARAAGAAYASAENAHAAPSATSTPPVSPAPFKAEAAPQQPAPEFIKVAVSALQWDGDWPELAASLPVRGIVQQLAFQSELIVCEHNGNGAQFQLRTPLQTLCSDGNIEKLAAVLTEHFGQNISITLKVEGPVWHTANARAEQARAVRQLEAERAVQQDDFVCGLLAEFGGHVVPQSVRPLELTPGA